MKAGLTPTDACEQTGSVLHPKCTVVAMGGPIVIGSHCIVEENVVIVNRFALSVNVGPPLTLIASIQSLGINRR